MNYQIQLTNQLRQHLRSFRRQRNMTQLQLAKALGINQSRISEIESDPGKMSVDNLLKILAILNVQFLLNDEASLGIGQPELSTPPSLSGLELIQFVKNKNNVPGGSW